MSMSKIIMDSLARRESFEKITEYDVNPLLYCGQRWWRNTEIECC